MGMTRQERIALHKKQERLQINIGVPDVNDLKEGVPVLRATIVGVVEYVRHNGLLYKNGKEIAVPICRECQVQAPCSKWDAQYPYEKETKQTIYVDTRKK